MSNPILSPLVWHSDFLELLDQRLLPGQEVWLRCTRLDEVIAAIRDMAVRGAPAIGIAAAYGAVLAYREVAGQERAIAMVAFEKMMKALEAARPTAVNLAWAVSHVRKLLADKPFETLGESLLSLAVGIHEEDLAANIAMGKAGSDIMAASLAPDLAGPFSVLTHCNTGSLATGGYGTALGVIRSAWQNGLIDRVYADETRPWLQGSRLTAWELQRDGIPVTLNTDSSAAWLMHGKNIKWVVVGADRITANGDVANKIGTYSLAVLARHHGIRFMVVAPISTIDMSLASGAEIEIEERSANELTRFVGVSVAPEGIEAANPVFDVTPAALVDVLVTDRGVVHKPDLDKMKDLFASV